ncbi:MAG: PEP-utilizing enzyme [Patescibacteria group bacterium]|nr:PEP-utilizing enzyme [Patescibacteria group bacterium]
MIQTSRDRYEFQWGEQHSLFSAEYWVDSYGSYAFGLPTKTDLVMLVRHSYVDTYAGKAMLQEWRAKSRKLLKPEIRDTLLHESRVIRRRYNSFFRTLDTVNISKLGNKELFLLLSTYRSILHRVAIYFVISQPEGVYAVTETLRKILTEKKRDNILYALITPTKLDIIAREQIELAAIGRRKNIPLTKLIEHSKRHAWLFFNSYDVKVNVSYLRKRLRDKYNEQRKRAELKRLRSRQKILLQSLRNPLLNELVYYLQVISLERLELKNCWGGAEYRFVDVFALIAKRIGIPLEEMMKTYRFPDFHKFLIKGIRLTAKERFLRLHRYVLSAKKGNITFSNKPSVVHKFEKDLLQKTYIKETNTIHGMIANPGVAIGICRIVPSQDIKSMMRHLKRFKRGDILVTWMTQPNMIPLAQHAGAIVADEGGITSHAAVISRELHKPCIVGTKIATKVFKDGDRVEVDATKGIVRRIK